MKFNRIVLFILALLTISSCGDRKYRYFTKINPDGSIFKRVITEGDSVDVAKGEIFPFDVNDGWTVSYSIEIKKKEDKVDTTHLAIAEKTFENAQNMHKSFQHNIDSLETESVHFKNEKKFRWFYNYYTYGEIFKQRFPLHHCSIDSFLNERECQFLVYEDKSIIQGMTKEQETLFEDSCEAKWEEYLAENLLIEFFEILDNYADSIGVGKASEQTRINIFNQKCEIDDDTWDSLWIKVDSLEQRGIANQALAAGKYESFIKIYDKAEWFEGVGTEYENTIEVPGLLFNTNGEIIKENTVQWSFKSDHFVYHDYIMQVQYRTTNTWAFIVSGILALLLIITLFYRKK